MIKIDGSFGEGGGQVLRTSLALSMLTGQKFKIENIRAGRKKPGLLRQHLTATEAASQICEAKTKDCSLSSQELVFEPGKVKPGNYSFKIGTAGSTTLVFQTILPVLLLANGQSKVEMEGGTHNPFAPPFHFLDKAFVRIVNSIGPTVDLDLDRFGFYPVGGGRFSANIIPAAKLKTINLLAKGNLVENKAQAFSSQIPDKIGKNEIMLVVKRLKWSEEHCNAWSNRAPGPGNILLLLTEFENVTEVFSGFGEIRIPLEKVVDDAVSQYLEYIKADVPVGKYLADQLLILMAMAGSGKIKTVKPTNHTLTNIEVIKSFLDIKIRVEQIEELQWLIELGG